MISDKFRCVFVHIPKTAGQSVEHFFVDLHGLSWEERSPLLLRFNSDPSLGPERLAHLTAEEYVQFGYLTNDLYASYFKFSFVRNPWSRLVSEYYFKNYYTRYTFKEFVKSALPKQDSYSDSYRHILPQYKFIYDSHGELLVDFVGRFENLQSDFDKVCSILGISKTILPHVNSSKERIQIDTDRNILAEKQSLHKGYTTYYDDELRDIVKEMYAMDISLFGYEFC
jgi:hypothetical protein